MVVVVFLRGVLLMFVVCFDWGMRDIAVRGDYKSSDKSLPSADRKTSLLSCLQDSVKYKSSISDLSLSVPKKRLNVVLGRSLSLRVNTECGNIVAFQHRF